MFIDENAPAVEKAAHATLQCMGIDAIGARFDEISRVAQARMEERLSHPSAIPPSGFTALDYMTEPEKEERHVLLIAIQMDERENGRRRARDRLVQRREDRKLRARLRRVAV